MKFIVAFSIALVVQIAFVASAFIGAAIFQGDTFLSSLVFNFYLPLINIMEKILNPEGKGEFGAVLIELPISVVIYSIIIGTFFAVLSRRKSKR